MRTAIIFGAADTGKRIFENVVKKYNILAITDNDSKKWGGNTCKELRLLVL